MNERAKTCCFSWKKIGLGNVWEAVKRLEWTMLVCSRVDVWGDLNRSTR